MLWLVYAFIGITIWSATSVADRFLLFKHVQSKRFYVVVPTVVQGVAVAILSVWFAVPQASLQVIAGAFASGVGEVFFLYYLFVAMSKEEVSRIFPFTTAGPIVTLLLGVIFLHETLTALQLVAFVLFVGGGFLLVARLRGGNGVSLSQGLKPLLLGSFISAAFMLLLRNAFVTSDFWTGFFYSRLGFLIAGLCVLVFFFRELENEWARQRPAIWAGIIGNQIIAFSGHTFYFLALSLSSAALVQSVLGAQSVMVFLFAYIVSLWKPDALGESVDNRDILQKIAGIVLIVAASYVLISAKI